MTASEIRRYIEQRGISARAIALRLGLHPGHLQRVLSGEREGSRAFLKSVVNAARTMPGRREENPDDVERLVDAAAHVFFLKRGAFESAICAGVGREKREKD